MIRKIQEILQVFLNLNLTILNLNLNLAILKLRIAVKTFNYCIFFLNKL
jgi:hypothetical protein